MRTGAVVRECANAFTGVQCRKWFAAVTSVTIFAGCDLDGVPGPSDNTALLADSAAFRAKVAAMLAQGAYKNVKLTGGDSINYWVSSYHCQTNCEGIDPNVGEIFVALPRKASIVTVTSFGPVYCAGLPQLRGFDVSGTLVDSASMAVESPQDCGLGDDNMTNSLVGELQDPQGRIDHFGITPPLVWTWQVPNPVPSLPPLDARALIDYTARILAPAPPPPVPDSLCPPTGDPVWDSVSVRQKAFEIFERSGATTKPYWEVKEHLFAVYKNPDGSLRTYEPLDIGSNQCERPFILPPPGYADSTLIALFHVHPFEAGQKMYCPDGSTETYTPMPLNGLGGYDIRILTSSMQQRAGMTPHALGLYVIDKDKIWKNPPDSAGAFFGRDHSDQRRPTACRWL